MILIANSNYDTDTVVIKKRCLTIKTISGDFEKQSLHPLGLN